MPNWASCSYAVTGEMNEVQSLYDRMKRLQEMKEPLKPNGFGTTWLGNLVEDIGIDYGKVSCRGSWDNLMLDDDVLTFTTESAWDRCHEVDDLIMEKYPSLSIAFRVEESGMAIYQKNDCHFFPEEYLIDIEDDDVYYCTEEQALQKLSDFFGIDFKDVEEAMILVNEHNEKDEEHVWVNEFELVE